MAYSTVTSKGQVTIPKMVRKRMGIDEGSRLLFVDDGDRILVYKVEGDLESLYGAVEHTGPPLDFGELKERMAEEIARQAETKLASSRGARSAVAGKSSAPRSTSEASTEHGATGKKRQAAARETDIGASGKPKSKGR